MMRTQPTTASEDYREIFNRRGASYHEAMIRYPDSRRQEFTHVLGLAEPEDGDCICDVPSGGGYLGRFIGKDVTLLSVESSEIFAGLHDSRVAPLVCVTDLGSLPIYSTSVDKVFSLAGLHHEFDKHRIFREIFRILRPGGALSVADVRAGSHVAAFLDVWVDRYNSDGHSGWFFDQRTAQTLRDCGFDVEYCAPIDYAWEFATPKDMAQYCRLLFGMDKATDYDVLLGIDKYLGVSKTAVGCGMNWQLYFLRAVKPLR